MSQMLILVTQVCHSLTPTQLSLRHLPKEDPGVGCKLRSILSLWHLFAEGWSCLLSWSRVNWETETTWCWERAWILGTHGLSDQKLSCCLCAKPKLKAMWVSNFLFLRKPLLRMSCIQWLIACCSCPAICTLSFDLHHTPEALHYRERSMHNRGLKIWPKYSNLGVLNWGIFLEEVVLFCFVGSD